MKLNSIGFALILLAFNSTTFAQKLLNYPKANYPPLKQKRTSVSLPPMKCWGAKRANKPTS